MEQSGLFPGSSQWLATSRDVRRTALTTPFHLDQFSRIQRSYYPVSSLPCSERFFSGYSAPTAPDPDPDPHLRMSTSGGCHRKCNNAFWLCIMPSWLPYLWFCWVSNVAKVRKSAPRQSLVMLIFFHSRNNWNFIFVTCSYKWPSIRTFHVKCCLQKAYQSLFQNVFKDNDTGKAAFRFKFTSEVPIWQFDFITRINEAVTLRINQKVAAIALT